MHHNLIIKDGDVTKVEKQILVDGIQFVDKEPIEGSDNPVTSGGVAKAVGNVAASVEQTEQDMKDMEEMFLVNLPIAAKSLRFEFSKMDYDPTVAGVGSNGTWKKVNAKFHNVWDWTRSSNDWFNSFNAAFQDDNNKVDVIAAGDLSALTTMRQMFFNSPSVVSIPSLNTSSVTNFSYAFYKTSLKEIPAIDTSNATDLSNFIREILTIKSIPLFDTGKATTVQNMCYGDVNVEEGALALYEQMSTQTTPPSTVANCFKDCGKDTTTGAAELAQIPASWGGLAAG